jgi:hypothetical protein
MDTASDPATAKAVVVPASPDVAAAKPKLVSVQEAPAEIPRHQPILFFIAAFALGVYLVASNTLQPWSSTVVVAGYTGLLYLSRSRVPLTGEIKDSAYYLGFSLNLIFLFVAFRNYGPQIATDQVAVLYLIQSLGSAIIATVAGLIGRYALYVMDDEEMIQKQVFLELQEEIKKSVSGFRQNQKALAQTVTGFVAARRKLAAEEEEASREYLTSVAGLLTEIQALQDSHVKAITDSIKHMEPAAALSLRQLRTLNEELGKLRQDFATAELAKALGDVKTALAGVDSSAHGVRGKFDALSMGTEDTTKKLTNMTTDAPRIQSELQAVDTILADFIEILRRRVSTWDRPES